MSRLTTKLLTSVAGLRGPGGTDGAPGANGTMAPASNAQTAAGTDNAVSITPAQLSYLGLTQGFVTAMMASANGIIGKATDPLDGTALGTGTVLYSTPVPFGGGPTLTSLKMFVKAAGTVTISRWSKSGTTVTRIATYTFNTSTLGLQTFTSVNFGSIPINPGEYLGVSGAGLGTQINGVTGSAGWWFISAGASTGTVGAPTTNVSMEFQFNFPYLYQAVTASALLAVQALVNAANLPQLSGPILETIARPVDPITGTGTGTWNNGTYANQHPVVTSGYLNSIKYMAQAAGSIQLVCFTKSGSNYTVTRVSPILLVSSAGLKTFTSADFGSMAIMSGEYLGFINSGTLGYTSNPGDGGGWQQVSAGSANTVGQTYAGGASFTTVRPEIQINIGSGFSVSMAAMQAQIAALQAGSANGAPLYTTGKSLWSWRAKLAAYKLSGTGKLKAILLGDSWMQQLPITQQFANILYAQTAKAGEGWIACAGGGDEANGLNGVTAAQANWTVYDASDSALPPAFGCAHDGRVIYTTGTTATYTVANFAATEARIYYPKTGGSFRYRIDSGSWTTVTGDGSNTLGVVNITGIGAGTHTLSIDTTVNTGGATAAIFGVYLTNTAGTGVEVLKCGNANMSGEQLANYVVSNVAPILANILPDVAVVIMGSNDFRRLGSSPSILVAAYRQLVTACRAANPNMGFVFVIPAQGDAVAVTGTLQQYRDAVWAMCQADGHDFYSMLDDFSSYANENAAGMWLNNLHLSNLGGYRSSSRIINRFLGL